MTSFFDIPGGPELPTPGGGGGGGGDYVPLDGSEQMTGGLVLAEKTASTAGNDEIFLNTDLSNDPCYRDSTGTNYYNLTEGSTPTIIL